MEGRRDEVSADILDRDKLRRGKNLRLVHLGYSTTEAMPKVHLTLSVRRLKDFYIAMTVEVPSYGHE
jgi:hypothetical protein